MSDQARFSGGKADDAVELAQKERTGGKTTATQPFEAAPDPDEDDLDDLDDMLNDFSAVKVQGASSTADVTAAKPAQLEEATAEARLSDDDFARQLQAGMAELLGELDQSPDMQAQLESMFKELAGAEGIQPDITQPVPTPGASADMSFQETIRQTMERMQSSGDKATTAATADAENPEDFMAELLKQMQGGGGLEGEANEAEFSKMLMGMMEQLTNKEILYEPMKELNERFPAWMDKNRGKTDKKELDRYEEQQKLVKEIVAKFEEKTYADSHAADREYIVERMQKVRPV
jgi:peroxin-19